MENDSYKKEITMIDLLEEAREILRCYCNINRITLGCTGCIYGDSTDEKYCSLDTKPYHYDDKYRGSC